VPSDFMTRGGEGLNRYFRSKGGETNPQSQARMLGLRLLTALGQERPICDGRAMSASHP